MTTVAKHFRWCSLLALCLTALSGRSLAQNRTVYFEDFEAGAGQEWASSKTSVTPIGQRRFLGEFGNTSVALRLNDLPEHTQITVSCDLFIIRSWDGNTEGIEGPDIWQVTASGAGILLRTTFDNHDFLPYQEYMRQSYPDTYLAHHLPGTGATEMHTLGYEFDYRKGGWHGADSVYHLSFEFTHSEESLALEFSASGLSALSNESWGLDNVQVEIDVPQQPKPYAGYSILIDASRDGGGWWYPQADPFDPNEPHQGEILADYCRSLGFSVTELPRDESIVITPELLAPYDIVIRANEYGAYSAEEVVAYQDCIYTGGKLLLIGDYVRPHEEDSLALSFGILFRGVSRGENVIDTFVPHPITDGISVLSDYIVGSGAVQLSPTAEILGLLSEATYLDLDGDETQDYNEPTGACALGRMPFGRGEIVFSGDINLWESVPQPLVDNTIKWLMECSAPVGGSVFGLEAEVVGCTNLTTGQTIQVPLEDLSTWYCEQTGLGFVPGDQVQMIIEGIVE